MTAVMHSKKEICSSRIRVAANVFLLRRVHACTSSGMLEAAGCVLALTAKIASPRKWSLVSRLFLVDYMAFMILGMVKKKSGHIVIISSVQGKFGYVYNISSVDG